MQWTYKGLLLSFLLGTGLVCFSEQLWGQEDLAREPQAKAQSKPKIHAKARPAPENPVIYSITITGNRKIEEAAVKGKLTSQVGEPFDESKIRQDVVELFGTGYFYDVQVDRQDTPKGVALSYKLFEKPSIVEIKYEGNSELEDSEIAETAGVKPYEILNMSKLQESVEKIEKLYEDKGYFLARVKLNVKTENKDGEEQARVTFKIEENDQVKVKKITFLGNKQLTSLKLKSVMATQEGGFFSFMSGSGAYKQEAFDRDLQVLRFLYFSEGFVQAKIDLPQVYVTPDKRGIYITFRVEEGERFNVGEIDFTGDLLFSREELSEKIEIKSGKQFSSEVLQKDLRELQAMYGDLGYAFANIIPRTQVHEKERLVDITFEIDKGNKVYIGKINVVGNKRTRDKVVRRELRIREGELYNETRKRESMDNVRRLGFFDEVNFNTKSPSENQDKLDFEIAVKERNTGVLNFGAGYSSYEKFVVNGQVSEINFLGRGQQLTGSVNWSRKQSQFRFKFVEPYFRDTEWELGFDIYQSNRSLTEYDERKFGGALSLGHPLAPYLKGDITYKLDNTHLKLGPDTDEELFPVSTANGLTSSMSFGLVYDKRDDRFAPSKGLFSSFSVEYAGLGGDLEYTKGFANARYYRKVFWDVVWRNNLTYGYITSNNPSKQIPFNELFLIGGANTLRGYNWFSIGKKKFSKKAFTTATATPGITTEQAYNSALKPFGGTQEIYYNLEFQFPLIEEAGIKGVVFYDVGYADDIISLNELKSGIGFGFRWFSPIGPLRFEWGFPVNPDRRFGEQGADFQFAIGSPF